MCIRDSTHTQTKQQKQKDNCIFQALDCSPASTFTKYVVRILRLLFTIRDSPQARTARTRHKARETRTETPRSTRSLTLLLPCRCAGTRLLSLPRLTGVFCQCRFLFSWAWLVWHVRIHYLCCAFVSLQNLKLKLKWWHFYLACLRHAEMEVCVCERERERESGRAPPFCAIITLFSCTFSLLPDIVSPPSLFDTLYVGKERRIHLHKEDSVDSCNK